MREVLCPNGDIAEFPENMSDEQIEEILRREFLDEPRPASLAPGEWTHRRNGASVTLSASMGRYVAYDAGGKPRGFRQTLNAAIDLADALPPPAPPRSKPEPQPVPKRIDVGVVAERQIAADIDSRIRRSEGQARRTQRFEIVDRRRKGRR